MSLEELVDNKSIRVIEKNYTESKGACWARHTLQQNYDDEQYTLQLDSHHRFIQDWDIELIEMMKMTGSEKPILTSYAGMYRPSDNQLLNVEPYKMVASNFTPGGTIMFRPHAMENWETLTKPVKARFVSGHFFFTLGIHCEEYKYDPNIYFAGDEISLSICLLNPFFEFFCP